MTPSERLRFAATKAGSDTRGPKAAVQTLWSMLHDEDPRVTSIAFRALGDATGISDATGYLGRQLGRLTASERAAACRAAADTLDACTCGSSEPDHFGNRDQFEDPNCVIHGPAPASSEKDR